MNEKLPPDWDELTPVQQADIIEYKRALEERRLKERSDG